MSTRILHIVANVQHADALAALVDAWPVLEDAGFEQLIVSPAGGEARVEVETDSARAWGADPARTILLGRTAAPAQIDAGDFDAVVCAASGEDHDVHASGGLERIVRGVAHDGGVVTAIGHADCPLVHLAGQDEPPVLPGAARSGTDAARTLVELLTRR